MANPFFSALGGMAKGGLNPMQMLSQFNQMLGQVKQNPLAMLQAVGLNVPANLNNSDAILQHLMNSGQINQNIYNQARQMAQQMGFR